MRTVGSSKGCFLLSYVLKNTIYYTDNYHFVNKKVILFSLFLIRNLYPLHTDFSPALANQSIQNIS
jgi:hypothetical protein